MFQYILQAFFNIFFFILRSGGVQIKGIIKKSIPKRKQYPVLESYKFALNETALNIEESVIVITQLIIENSRFSTIKVAEILDDCEENTLKLISPILLNALRNHPDFQPEVTIYTKRLMDLPDSDIQVNNKVFVIDEKISLIIGVKLLQNTEVYILEIYMWV